MTEDRPPILDDLTPTSAAKPKHRPTRQDVARMAGVSTATVSYVISGRSDVQISDATRRRVRKAAEDLGYRPHPIASALKTGRTGLIAVWVANLNTTYYADVVHHLDAQIIEHSRQTIVNMENSRKARGAEGIPLLADGVIAHEQDRSVRELLDRAARPPVPVVSTGSEAKDDRTDWVGIDLGVGATEAMEHLVRLGRKRIAFVAEAAVAPFDRWRTPAYRTVMEQAELAPEYILPPDKFRASAREEVGRYVHAHGCPDALFCHNDEVAIGAYRGLRDLGIRVPDDVVLVGCDGIAETEYGDCPLSTIVQPIEEMCRLAWQLLERRFENPEAPLEHITLPARLVVRQSSQT